MSLPEKDPSPESAPDPLAPQGQPQNTDFPETALLPEDFTPLVRPEDLSSSSPARRRRARRKFILPQADERTDLLEDLARRALPTLEFFLLAMLSGFLLGAGFLLDSDALLLVGLLLAPLLIPWAGMALAIVTGGTRYFLQTLTSLFVAFLLAFFTSAIVGLFNRIFDLTRFYRAADHAKFWWIDLLVVTAGAFLLTLAFSRREQRPFLPSILLAYAFFLPACSAGFGLGAGLPLLWPNGLIILGAHFALATLVGCLTLLILKFKPKQSAGYALPVIIALVCLAALIASTGLASWVIARIEPPAVNLTPTPLGLVSPTPGLPPTHTPGAATATSTLQPLQQPSTTPTSTPVPSFAVIAATSGGGALVRTEPGGGTVVATLINGTLVEVLPEITAIGSNQWVLIRAPNGLQGWVLQTVLVAATPAPPAVTTPTATP